ncbi:Phosphatidylinositol N-acetylglucosaminyltransferase gpi3 subunit [Smittium mucronatum]|uniref:Phosphatidylinositol N-acetylglucosaminyltransferase GPI3 subunit n=1 Tax=Smittium mucronatum TaxID=133383 RepID=A0A1R0H6X5_9FUNG|nr:Phosphatidylinositol N-acetylglucosaminyltransferase gpi3 subunit [Smittium mucronatum]
MITDFFYPNIGGVESHVYNNSQCLILRGHKVVVVTHAYGKRSGVRYLAGGLKVYYVPAPLIFGQASLPTFFCTFAIFRNIFIREGIEIVHGHQAFSTFCHEAILHARTMGLKTVFTDHSLLGFADVSGILMNKLLKFTLSDVGHVICVSHTSKENTVLRAALDPRFVSAIPNAIVPEYFEPIPLNLFQTEDRKKWITVVILSRLVYRKGMDLLTVAIPRICQMHKNVRFIIGGEGPKRVDLEQMREKYTLQDRVTLLGEISASDVRNILIRGDIFLNTSLTEAFCISIVEAASCGLLVVSTKVGGIPEVLPEHMLTFAKPNENDIVDALSNTIFLAGKRKTQIEEMLSHKAHKHISKSAHSDGNIVFESRNAHSKKNISFFKPLIATSNISKPLKPQMDFISPQSFHNQVKSMYSWHNVAYRTEIVYHKVINLPEPPLIERLRLYYGCGRVAGKLFCMVAVVDYLLMVLFEIIWPSSKIEMAPDFPARNYRKIMESRKHPSKYLYPSIVKYSNVFHQLQQMATLLEIS